LTDALDEDKGGVRRDDVCGAFRAAVWAWLRQREHRCVAWCARWRGRPHGVM